METCQWEIKTQPLAIKLETLLTTIYRKNENLIRVLAYGEWRPTHGISVIVPVVIYDEGGGGEIVAVVLK